MTGWPLRVVKRPQGAIPVSLTLTVGPHRQRAKKKKARQISHLLNAVLLLRSTSTDVLFSTVECRPPPGERKGGDVTQEGPCRQQETAAETAAVQTKKNQ